MQKIAVLTPVLTAVITITGTIGFSVASAGPAAAAVNYTLRGPSAGADQFGNQYVFWRGTGNQLESAYYNVNTRTFDGPFNLRMGPLGSEPSVAVSNTGGYVGPGGHRYGAQYVFWESTGRAPSLFFAYWAGSWHGPYNLGKGPLGSQPAAAFNDVGGASAVSVFWRGTDGNLWRTYSINPTNPRSYSAAQSASFGGRKFGPLGSSPAASNSQPTTVLCCANSAPGYVAWKGTDGGFWQAEYNINYNGSFSWISGATKAPRFGRLGSPPSLDVEYLPPGAAPLFDDVWQGTDGRLWYAPVTTHAFPINVAGQLGSAPTIAWSAAHPQSITGNPGPQLYVFWKGRDGHLWEAFYNGTSWGRIGYPRFGILG